MSPDGMISGNGIGNVAHKTFNSPPLSNEAKHSSAVGHTYRNASSMQRIKQKSSIAGIAAVAAAVAGLFFGFTDVASATAQIAGGLGLIAVDA